MPEIHDRIDLIEQRMGVKPGRKREVNSPLAALKMGIGAAVTAAIVCVLAFPFRGMSIGAIAGLVIMVGMGVALYSTYASRLQRLYHDVGRRRALFVLMVLIFLGSARALFEFFPPSSLRLLMIPAPLVAMVLAVVYERWLAFDTMLLLVFLLATMLVVTPGATGVELGSGHIAAIATLFTGAAAAVLLTHNLRSRTRLLRVGALSGAAMALAALVFELIGLWGSDGAGPHGVWMLAGVCLVHGAATGILVTSLIPVFEYVFGIVTDLRLLELEDGNHPLLRTMLERSPGTYMHTQNVARIATAAVEAAGGNVLLTRVGVLFHDLGKMVRPEYFTENEPNSKLYHDRLSPAMSAMIIISHVKEGVEIARQHRLPRILEDFITGHHGTSLVKYFYRMAKMRAREGERVEEGQFRYPGPKPQTREAALVAIADLVEAAGRAKLDGPQSPATIQKFVHESIMDKLHDGQFDECDLTMRDLRVAEEAMVKTLASMYHHRIKYPDDPDARKLKLATIEKEEYRKELSKRRERILTQ